MSSLSRAGRLLALVPGWVLVLGAFAYRALFLDALHLPASSRFESWVRNHALRCWSREYPSELGVRADGTGGQEQLSDK